jgi:Bacterial regulatory helix-turn-helix protein, lysR family
MDGDQAVGDVSGSSGGTALHTCGGRIHCAQSNVTTRIRALEDELGAPLFNRLAKRLTASFSTLVSRFPTIETGAKIYMDEQLDEEISVLPPQKRTRNSRFSLLCY